MHNNKSCETKLHSDTMDGQTEAPIWENVGADNKGRKC